MGPPAGAYLCPEGEPQDALAARDLGLHVDDAVLAVGREHVDVHPQAVCERLQGEVVPPRAPARHGGHVRCVRVRHELAVRFRPCSQLRDGHLSDVSVKVLRGVELVGDRSKLQQVGSCGRAAGHCDALAWGNIQLTLLRGSPAGARCRVTVLCVQTVLQPAALHLGAGRLIQAHRVQGTMDVNLITS